MGVILQVVATLRETRPPARGGRHGGSDSAQEAQTVGPIGIEGPHERGNVTSHNATCLYLPKLVYTCLYLSKLV